MNDKTTTFEDELTKATTHFSQAEATYPDGTKIDVVTVRNSDLPKLIAAHQAAVEQARAEAYDKAAIIVRKHKSEGWEAVHQALLNQARYESAKAAISPQPVVEEGK